MVEENIKIDNYNRYLYEKGNMMTGDYFWQEERDIPPGSGFNLFGVEHIIVLMVIAIVIIAFVFLFVKCNPKHRQFLISITAILLPILELLKSGMLISCERMDIGHLPLHLCSMAIYVYPVIAFLRDGKVREALTEISVITLLPAAISAIVFPDWTMYSIINFYSLHAFVWRLLPDAEQEVQSADKMTSLAFLGIII